jgi:peptidoglycan/LPS O-acetylase OafA/YrhL
MNVLLDHFGWINYPLGVLWSLSVEEVFYLAFPILCVAMRQERRLLAFWLAIIALAPAYRLFHQGDEGGFLYAYFACFDGIAMGCCTALLAGSVVPPARTMALVQWAAAVAMICLYLFWPIAKSNVLGVTAMSLGAAVLLLGGRDRGDGTSRERNHPLGLFGWLGRRSYELYLFHLVVLGALRTMFPPQRAGGDEKMLLMGAFFVLSIAISAGIHRFYSEPLNRGIRRRIATPAPWAQAANRHDHEIDKSTCEGR